MANHFGGGALVQKPLTELGHRHVLELIEDGLIDCVLDDTGDLVLLIGNGRGVTQIIQRQMGENHLRGNSLLSSFGGNACQLIAGFFLVGLGHHFAYALELVHMAKQLCFENHATSPLVKY